MIKLLNIVILEKVSKKIKTNIDIKILFSSVKKNVIIDKDLSLNKTNNKKLDIFKT